MSQQQPLRRSVRFASQAQLPCDWSAFGAASGSPSAAAAAAESTPLLDCHAQEKHTSLTDSLKRRTQLSESGELDNRLAHAPKRSCTQQNLARFDSLESGDTLLMAPQPQLGFSRQPSTTTQQPPPQQPVQEHPPAACYGLPPRPHQAAAALPGRGLAAALQPPAQRITAPHPWAAPTIQASAQLAGGPQQQQARPFHLPTKQQQQRQQPHPRPLGSPYTWVLSQDSQEDASTTDAFYEEDDFEEAGSSQRQQGTSPTDSAWSAEVTSHPRHHSSSSTQPPPSREEAARTTIWQHRAAAVEDIKSYPPPMVDYPPASFLHELEEANACVASLQLPEGLQYYPLHPSCFCLRLATQQYQMPAIAMCLGASYLQRLLAYNPSLFLQAKSLDWFVHEGQNSYMCSHPAQPGQETILSLYITCCYLALKVSSRVPFKQQLSHMMAHLVGRAVTEEEVVNLEAVCLEGLRWRLGPYFNPSMDTEGNPPCHL